MKLTPLALLNRSSVGDNPSRMLGLLRTSSDVKNHWFAMATGDLDAAEWAGEGALRRDDWGLDWADWGLGGDVRDVWVGGDGTAGGTSRLLIDDEGDFDVEGRSRSRSRSRSDRLVFGGRTGG